MADGTTNNTQDSMILTSLAYGIHHHFIQILKIEQHVFQIVTDYRGSHWKGIN